MNIGLPKARYAELFGSGEDGDYDFTALDRLMPHPIYSRNHFVCVLSPSDSTFETLKPLLDEAYQLAVRRRTNPTPEDEAQL